MGSVLIKKLINMLMNLANSKCNLKLQDDTNTPIHYFKKKEMHSYYTYIY